ncbi:TPA: three-Cys-motif partner protein TcmP [Pseudomonas aeruginosa]|uniref:three-Cys-motif partner protein TcmP n=1 Tax=Pseudomonas aeruginosa TaxID=287 RepID=UPI0003B9CC84|nr:three-Cys-motif partner protein TcmP [Pseudomonas aeruginosa]ERU97060.1 hypothetical protein Q081_02073 [Pseudomonas aeruginosa M8A.2]ERZ49011.1 hypothetical protein Q082_00187 [Pseudomonas aeruginosa M8A.3]
MAVIPKEYIDREQAFIKHTILRTYLQRLLMIIGRSETIVNYVDCFAGPWSAESAELDDTSIGISLQQMKQCHESLIRKFGKTIRFRALYIEKDKKAYEKLKSFLANNHLPIEVECIHGDYTENIDKISQWTGGAFTFFFVDPKGWKKVVSAPTLAPLLRLKKVEFLINFMYDFLNRAMNIDEHVAASTELLGKTITFTGDESSSERQQIIVSRYREAINAEYSGRTAFVPVERPGKERILYFLIYLTRHPLGVMVFKEAAEEMLNVQRVTQFETKLRRQMEDTGTLDLFGADACCSMFTESLHPQDNRFSAKEYLLEKLSDKKPLLLDYEQWASFLEESDLYPSDFQLALKDLLKDGRVKNLDVENINRRTKKPAKPNWPSKSERWILL